MNLLPGLQPIHTPMCERKPLTNQMSAHLHNSLDSAHSSSFMNEHGSIFGMRSLT